MEQAKLFPSCIHRIFVKTGEILHFGNVLLLLFEQCDAHAIVKVHATLSRFKLPAGGFKLWYAGFVKLHSLFLKSQSAIHYILQTGIYFVLVLTLH